MGDRLEERKDFTAEVTAKLPEAKKLAEVRRGQHEAPLLLSRRTLEKDRSGRGVCCTRRCSIKGLLRRRAVGVSLHRRSQGEDEYLCEHKATAVHVETMRRSGILKLSQRASGVESLAI